MAELNVDMIGKNWPGMGAAVMVLVLNTMFRAAQRTGCELPRRVTVVIRNVVGQIGGKMKMMFQDDKLITNRLVRFCRR